MNSIQFRGRRIWESDTETHLLTIPFDEVIAITDSYIETASFVYRLSSPIKIVNDAKLAAQSTTKVAQSAVQKMNETTKPDFDHKTNYCPKCGRLF